MVLQSQTDGRQPEKILLVEGWWKSIYGVVHHGGSCGGRVAERRAEGT